MSKTDKKTATKTDNIEKMDFNQLRKTVRLLYDELALFKRKYNDAIMNLDEGNFGKSLTFTQNRMKSQIRMNAQEISTKLSTEELNGRLLNYSTITQTADAISTAVGSINNTTDEKLKSYSTIEQTAEAITTTVTSSFVTSLISGDFVTNTQLETKISVSADEIKSYVSKTYETKDNATQTYSTILQNESSISSKVSDLETLQNSVFTQTTEGFVLDGEKTTFTGVLYLTDDTEKKVFSIFYDNGSQGSAKIMLHNCDGAARPISIGSGDDVYIGTPSNENRVATHSWVLNNAGSGGGSVVAVFA